MRRRLATRIGPAPARKLRLLAYFRQPFDASCARRRQLIKRGSIVNGITDAGPAKSGCALLDYMLIVQESSKHSYDQENAECGAVDDERP
jgi:hypothetical protein